MQSSNRAINPFKHMQLYWPVIYILLLGLILVVTPLMYKLPVAKSGIILGGIILIFMSIVNFKRGVMYVTLRSWNINEIHKTSNPVSFYITFIVSIALGLGIIAFTIWSF